jgi:hypothetical protein
MINGPGQALFLGNPNVSQFGAGGGGQTSPGSGYVPDEVAKMIVKESGLRKSDTIPKRVIIGYLESMGLSPGLATDVAMVLRNMYGVTPTFDESTLYGRSGALIEELTNVVSESYPAPFRIDEPEVLFEADVIGRYIAGQYLESKDEEYDVVLEHFATISPHDFLDIVEFYEWVGHEGFAYLGDLVENGPEGLADEVLEGLCYPNKVAFMSEDVQYHVDMVEDAADDVIARGTAKSRAAASDASYAAAGVKRTRNQPGWQDRKKAYLQKKAQKKPAHPYAAAAARQKKVNQASRDAQKKGTSALDRSLAKGAVAQSKMKKKGNKALDFMKKVGSGVAKHAGTAAKHAGSAAGAVAQGAGYLKGRAQGGAERGRAAAAKASEKSSAPAPEKSSAPASAKKKLTGGVFNRVGQVLKGFKDRFLKKRPGVASQTPPSSTSSGATVKPPVGESTSRSGSLLSEMRDVLDDTKRPYATEDPFDVFETFEVRDLVGQAVIEALSQLDWDEVCQLASISMLPVEESQALVTAYQNGSGDFFHAWRGAKSRVDMPSALTQESFSLLADLSIDEGVVPALVGYSYRAVQVASPDVAMCIEDVYPDLGKTAYGPAGDPKEGPQLAKSFMTPHATSTDAPNKDRQVMATRMFADPDVTARERESKLSDVKNVLGAMRAAADSHGVAPEGMFLNTYRDMHREKARYS